MKRIIMLSVIVAFLGISCSLSKEDKLYRTTVDGTWQLTNVDYTGAQGQFSSVLFKDADAKCFGGSTWYFNHINSTGYYDIPQGLDCVGGQRDIRWSILDQNGIQQLQFKFIDEKKKDITGYGFRLTIDYLDDTSMTLRSSVSVDGEPVNVIYKFQKINQ
ncbi:lipocalin-like protein [Balneicella halophila]|uniref:Lipocalin-like protein n=1 Tax=Balneicella halophila TaxID=1537566 RepID=A0A7L4UQX4_BALHA|nr:lipocalin family protein [Balneicella halophila]PVX52069.1 lipocalin-like protein [Balneicella halophila]